VQDSPKFTQIGALGLKIYHLATLARSAPSFSPHKKNFLRVFSRFWNERTDEDKLRKLHIFKKNSHKTGTDVIFLKTFSPKIFGVFDSLQR
jgi:hypothetical protein